MSTAPDNQAQKWSVRFYHDGLTDHEEELYCKRLGQEELEDIPKLLRPLPSIVQQLKRGTLWVLNLDYEPEKVECIGLHDKLDIDTPEKLDCVRTLNDICQSEKVQLFLRLRDDHFSQAFGKFEEKILYEHMCPSFHEYLPKNLRPVVQRNNDHFGPKRDKILLEAHTHFPKL